MAPPVVGSPSKPSHRLEILLFLHALECYREQLRAHLLSPLTLSMWVEAAQKHHVLAKA